MQTYPGLFASESERFKIEYLFFSRTDKRGVIQSGNETFQYIAGYDWSELIGAPHKVVRHPDMPKGVFHLLWAAIQADKPIGGYVVNQTKQGKPYWVFAVMMPTEAGYVSIRLKPSSDILPKVKKLYSTLRYEEDANNRTPEESADALVKGLCDLGYDDYSHFMSEALVKEHLLRLEAMHKPAPQVFANLRNIQDSAQTVEELGGTVEVLFARTEQIPYNMRLQAGRLEGTDGPISVISDNHRQMAQSLSHSLSGFREAAELGAGPLRDALFVTAVTALIPEITAVYMRQQDADEANRKVDINQLNALSVIYEQQSRAAVSNLAERARQFARICRDMRRMMSGLEMTRIMCKIERSKAQGDTEGLDEIVNRLQSSEQELNKVMTQVEDAVRLILEASDHLMRKNGKEAA